MAKKEKVVELLKEQLELEEKLANREGLSRSEQDRLAELDTLLKGGTIAQAEFRKKELLAEQEQINKYLADNPQLSETAYGSLNASPQFRRLREIQEELSKIGDTSGSLSAISEGKLLFDQRKGENELDIIDREAEEERAKARVEAEETLVELRTKLTDKTGELATAEADLKTASDNVVTALDRLTTSTDANFQAIETRTKAHVDAQIQQINRLKGAYGSLYGNSEGADQQAAREIEGIADAKFATGGPVSGQGGTTSDSIKEWHRNGEFVINAAATKLYRPIIERINSMSLPIPRFAGGGPVTTNNSSSQTINVNQQNYGDAARFAPDPRMIRWHLRKFA